MTNTMQKAMDAMNTLPIEARDICANRIVENVEKLLRLRADVQEGLHSAQTEKLYTIDEAFAKMDAKYGV